MKNFYFTFGQAHFTTDGIPMKDYYVKVSAPDYGKARIHFCDHFAAPMMGSPTKWAFQSTEDDFNEHFFPDGQYGDTLVASAPASTDSTF